MNYRTKANIPNMAIWTLFSRTCDLCKRVVPRMGDSSMLPALRNRNKRYPILLFDLISTNTSPSLNAELPHRYFSDTVIRTTAGLPPACRLPYTTTVEFHFCQIETPSTLMEIVPTCFQIELLIVRWQCHWGCGLGTDYASREPSPVG